MRKGYIDPFFTSILGKSKHSACQGTFLRRLCAHDAQGREIASIQGRVGSSRQSIALGCNIATPPSPKSSSTM